MVENLKVKYSFDIIKDSGKIYCSNNEDVLSDLVKQYPNGLVDLIYIDPPFYSGKNYELIWRGKDEKGKWIDGYEIQAYTDRMKGGINKYIEWMIPKIDLLHKILKSTGSFYLHCDHHASHYLKVECDKIFGIKNFRNEIIWHYKNKIGRPTRKFLSDYDTILFYSKSNDYIFNPQFVEIDNPLTLKRYDKIDKNGKRYKIYHTNGVDRKVYLKPKSMGAIWEINNLSANSKERIGYQTQKPEALLERIINGSSNKDDIVLDAFCGCGTTSAVADRLKRKFIGIDISFLACDETARRVGIKEIDIIGMKYTKNELKTKLKPLEFQYWTIKRIGGRPNPRQTGDEGIDGWVDTNNENNVCIEVKQKQINFGEVMKFEAVIRKSKKKTGYMIGFSFSRKAYEEIASFKAEGESEIITITVDDLLKNEPKKYNIIRKSKRKINGISKHF